MLAKRLARKGLSVSGPALAAALAQNGASAGVPPGVASITIKAASLFAAGNAAGAVSVQAVALAEGVVKATLLTRLKITTALLAALALLSAGVAALGQKVQGDKPGEQPIAEKPE